MEKLFLIMAAYDMFQLQSHGLALADYARWLKTANPDMIRDQMNKDYQEKADDSA